MGAFQFDCDLCDATVGSTAVEAVKEQGRTHLANEHRDELEVAFGDRYAGESCENDCGYVFPVGDDEAAGFGCPECGHNHLSAFVRRYLYWRIEDGSGVAR